MAAHLTTGANGRERARLHFGLHALLAFLAVVVGGIPFVLLILLVRAKSNWLVDADHRIDASLHSYGARHSAFVSAMKVVSAVGSPEAWWVIVVPVAVLLVRAGARRRAAFLVVTVGGSWLLNHILKSAVSRARPHFSHAFATASGSSFPSGHAQAAAAVVGALLVAGWPWIATRLRALVVAVGVLVVALVCFSRLALGVHYLSDVVAAAIVALAWVALMTAAFSVWQDEARGSRRTA